MIGAKEVALAICAASPRDFEVYREEFEEQARAAISAHLAALERAGWRLARWEPPETASGELRLILLSPPQNSNEDKP